jgi:hypothetical protein
MSYPLRAAVVLLSLSSLAACQKVQARTPVASPALTVPAPEGRLVIPALPVEAPVEVPVSPDPPPPTTPAPKPTGTPNNRPSQPATLAPPPAAPPPASDGLPQVLQTTNVGELERQARSLINNAERDLGRLQPGELSRDSQQQYSNAKTFLQRSKNAIEIRNYVLAVELAGKAATLAGQLVKG